MSNTSAKIEHLSVFVKIIYHNWHGIKMALILHQKTVHAFPPISKLQIAHLNGFFQDFSLQVAQMIQTLHHK